MSLRHCEVSTQDLLAWKKSLEFERSNWKRRIEEQKRNYCDMLRPIAVYRRWLKYCEKEIAIIDAVLKERMKDGGDKT